jgi:hypothetical protein
VRILAPRVRGQSKQCSRTRFHTENWSFCK